jgi:hypothetical protein
MTQLKSEIDRIYKQFPDPEGLSDSDFQLRTRNAARRGAAIGEVALWMERMGKFAEWASQHYTYVENDKWDGDNDATFTTPELIEIFLESLQ